MTEFACAVLLAAQIAGTLLFVVTAVALFLRLTERDQ